MNYQSGAVSAGDCISEGWELIRPHYWTYILMTLVVFVILFALSMVTGLINNIITYAVAFAVGGAGLNAEPGLNVRTLLPQGVSLVISLIMNLFTVTVTGIMSVGYYRALERTSREGTVEFNDIFSAFSAWPACFAFAVVSTILQLVGVLVFGAIGAAAFAGTVGLEALVNGSIARRPENMAPLIPVMIGVGLIFFLVYVVWAILQTMVYPLIARNVPGIEAVMTSIRAGFANFGGLLLLLILCVLMIIGGLLLCVIGSLFVVPIVYAAIYRASEYVFGRPVGPTADGPPPPPEFGQAFQY